MSLQEAVLQTGKNLQQSPHQNELSESEQKKDVGEVGFLVLAGSQRWASAGG